MTKTVELLNEREEEVADDTDDPTWLDNEDEDGSFIVGVEDRDEGWKIHHMRCAAHTLQLAIQDGLKGRGATNILMRAKNVVKHLRNPIMLAIVRNSG